MSVPILTLVDIHTHIDSFHLLQGVTFEVPENEVTVLLGRNGAGKTTTLRTIMGLWQASAGQILFKGRPIQRTETADIARQGVAYVPEDMGIFSGLTVEQNLLLATRSGRFDPERLTWLFNLFPPLKRFWELPAGNLSGGQKQMLSIGRAIIEPRALILVDEPTKGIAPAIIDDMLEAFKLLKAARTTILLVEQNFGFASELGDHVAVMDNGRIVHTGPMSALVQDNALQQRYLGLSLPESAAESST
jgi:branched-chain amino acid transport system ATP-binding protein